ncbi:MAG: DUF5662 family protein [Lachnospiraceae bacterium]|nr:DUF5662 family protein [Lachnospiraceae bacterium]
MNWWHHLKTINHHKWLVMKHCFAIGLYRQGLLHDLSKYSPVEFLPGAKYYQGGKRSPNNAEREDRGYSQAWLHHKGRNKHHMEYWIDYQPGKHSEVHSAAPSADYTVGADGYLLQPNGYPADGAMVGCKMPVKYVLEMFCDRVAACKNYNGSAYTDADAYEYFMRGKSHYIIHPESGALLEKLLLMLKEKGEEETFRYIRVEILHKKK